METFPGRITQRWKFYPVRQLVVTPETLTVKRRTSTFAPTTLIHAESSLSNRYVGVSVQVLEMLREQIVGPRQRDVWRDAQTDVRTRQSSC